MPAVHVLADEPIKALADEFRALAASRRAVTPGDPAADALAYCATRVDETRHAAAAQLAMCSSDEYAALPEVNASASTVRRWCAAGQLPGAVLTANEQWRIPRTARRVSRAVE